MCSFAIGITCLGSVTHGGDVPPQGGANGTENWQSHIFVEPLARDANDAERAAAERAEAAVWVAYGRMAATDEATARPDVSEVPDARVAPSRAIPETGDAHDRLPEQSVLASEGLIHGRATHYGISYQDQPLGCGTGVYQTDDPSIVAVSPERYRDWPCGTLLRVCGRGGCISAIRQDACPGCAVNQLDLSEYGIDIVCGAPESSTCDVSIEVMR